MIIRFLGTGTSVGVPQIGCNCHVCRSHDSRDKRRRCGLYVQAGAEAFLVDTPPELRTACLEYGISHVDAVVLTHAHMDHLAGFDDVRRFNTINGRMEPCDPHAPGANGRTFRLIGKPLRCYALPETIAQVHRIFPYIGTQPSQIGLYRPQVEFHPNTESFTIGTAHLTAFPVEHGFPCCGYLIESNGVRFAYASDCNGLSPETIEFLKDVDVLVIDCLREREHVTHFNKDRALQAISRIAPRQAYITHMCHDLTHVEWEAILPQGVSPAYDGLVLTLGEEEQKE